MLSLFKKILFYSFFVLIFFGGTFGSQEVLARCWEVLGLCGVPNYTCTSGTPDRYSENGMQSTWYCNGLTICQSSCKHPGDCPNSTLCTATLPYPTVTLTANPISVIAGASSTLTWNVANATSCTATGETLYWAGSDLATSTGAHTWSTGILNEVNKTYTYGITCTGAGRTASATTTVTTIGATAVSVTLTASPSSLMFGQTSTLTWNVANATSCTASGIDPDWNFSPLASTTGSHSWTTRELTTSSTYKISCTGDNGPAVATATVTVNTENIINTNTIDNSIAVSGGSNISKCAAVDVSWDAYSGASKYDVVCVGDSNCNSLSTSSRAVTIRNLTPDTNYSFIINAYNSLGVKIASATTNSVKSGLACGLTGDCNILKGVISPSVNNTTTWTASLTPACPDCTYIWSGTDINSSTAPTSNPFSKIYTTIGLKNIGVLVKNSIGATFCTASSTATVSFTGGTTMER